jgi:Tfp pilus assembly protein PilZ
MRPRKDRRFKQWNKTKITLLGGPRDSKAPPAVDAFTYDLSIGGARLHTAESFEIGTRIRLEIALVRTGETLRVEGLVKWRRWEESANVFEMGVEFQHTSMVTVLTLMKNLHDARGTSDRAKPVPDSLSRS